MSSKRGQRGRNSGNRPGGQRRPRGPAWPCYDLYAAYPCGTREDVQRIVGNHRQPYRELEWPHTKVSLLTLSLVERIKEYAKGGDRRGGGYKSLLHSKGDNEYIVHGIRPALGQLAILGIYPPRVDLKALPPYSWFLQFRFILDKPYISGDDEIFYIHDNPLLKEPVFKVPMVRPSSWKGIVRGVMRQLIPEAQQERILQRLFGQARDDEEDGWGVMGRLRFYPTFFDRIDLDVSNPHSRKTKAGTVPIMWEIVPSGAMGFFSLLYVPFDLIGHPEDEVRQEVREDLDLTCRAVHYAMRVYGFSAKRTRGYGLAKPRLLGRPPADTEGGELQMREVSLPEGYTFRSFREMQKLVARIVEQLT